ncbi:MAG: OB-fold nucleic acid binding domain-containing protein [Methanopyri archaeon]|jgi:RPA family protein|nr:OB-fold nucleic acid binding domain-containing protein [Methanopyri archaeon]
MEGQELRRRPSVEREIGTITTEDRRVRIIGTVVGKDSELSTIALDDGTGTATAFFDDLDLIERLDGITQGDMVKLIGRVVPLEGGFELRGEAVEKINNLDVGLLKRVRDLEAKMKGE